MTRTISSSPLVAVGGFQHDGTPFDTVGVAAAEVHGYHATENPELSAVTYAVFPAFTSEISGRENEEEAWGRFRKMLQPNKLDRTEVPFVKMRYHNTRTRSMSKGDARGFAPWTRWCGNWGCSTAPPAASSSGRTGTAPSGGRTVRAPASR
ncbi:hypothetical protein ACFT1B_07160 [Streptomyces griseoincarnatus]